MGLSLFQLFLNKIMFLFLFIGESCGQEPPMSVLLDSLILQNNVNISKLIAGALRTAIREDKFK